MEFSIATPAILFPGLSLLLLAYTNKFLAIASLIRKLYSDYETEHTASLHKQIMSLRRRLNMIRLMQLFGASSFLACIISMLFMFINKPIHGKITFGISLLLILTSLCFTIAEIIFSAGALRVLLVNLEEKEK
jgi:hypothetical protein